MKIRSLHPDFGAEILDFDADKVSDAAWADEFRELFRKHNLLLIRGQDIDVGQQIALVNLLAPVVQEGTAGEDFTFVSTTPNEYVSGFDPLRYHSDYAFSAFGPIQVISLYAMVVDFPEPTVFASGAASVRKFPAELRDRLRNMEIIQCQAYGAKASKGLTRNRVSQSYDLPASQFISSVHPAISRDPVTGEEVILINECMTSNFVGMTEEESDVLFSELEQYQYHPDNLYQHDWQQKDLIFWNNIALQHGRPALSERSGRTLRRVVGNPVPVQEMMKDLEPDPGRFTYRSHLPDEANLS